MPAGAEVQRAERLERFSASGLPKRQIAEMFRSSQT